MKVEARYANYREALRYVQMWKPNPQEAMLGLTRHGETVYNTQNKFQAWHPDVDRLTTVGIQQAQRLREALVPFPLSWIASSDFLRAFQTSEIIRGSHNIKINTFQELCDFNYGSLAELTHSGGKNEFKQLYPDLYSVFKEDRLNFAAPGGESYQEFAQRVQNGLSMVLSKSWGRFSLIVSHRAWVREAIASLLNSGIKENIPVDNTSLTIFHLIQHEYPKLILFNNTEHLKNIV